LWVPGPSVLAQADLGPGADRSGARVGLGGIEVEAWVGFPVAVSAYVATISVVPAVKVGG
jgi:hypothetical protein